MIKDRGVFIIKTASIDKIYEEKTDINIDYLLDNVIFKAINNYIEKIKEQGLKSQINKCIKGGNLDKKIISLVKKHLSSIKDTKLPFRLGWVNIQYRNNMIHINPSGIIGWIVSEITISNQQLIMSTDDMINQIEEKYILDTRYIKSKFKEILISLSKEGVYKPETSEEKTLYDLLFFILMAHNKDKNNLPNWIQPALKSLPKSTIIKSLLNSMVGHVTSLMTTISENLYVDLRLALDSKLVRITLNKKTNKGQIASFLHMFGVEIDKKLNEFVENYMSQSFINGFGELIVEIVSSLLYNVAEENKISLYDNVSNKIQESLQPLQITMCMGNKPFTQRTFRWYTPPQITQGDIQISRNKDLSMAKNLSAYYEKIVKPKTVINFGLMSKYKLEEYSKFSCAISDLEPNTKYWYRVGNYEKNIWSPIYSFTMPAIENEFTFINLSDSQGMIKSDYDTFIKVFNNAKCIAPNAEFITHLGDFVDDGNNENYWNWVLDSTVWKENAVIPLAGNHEAWISNMLLNSNVENAIVRHFYIKDIPNQNTLSGIYYSYVYKNATFIVLNTNDIDHNKKLNEEQFNWALNICKNSTTKWKILLMHKSIYSNGPHSDDEDVKCIAEQIKLLCDGGKIDLVLSGHDHVYVRTPFLKNDKKQCHKTKFTTHNGIQYETAINPEGTLFIMPGTSGVKNYRQDLSMAIKSETMSQPGCPIYSTVKITKDTIYFTAYKYNSFTNKSQVFDAYAIEKNYTLNLLNNVNKNKIKANSLDEHKKTATVTSKKEFIDALLDINVYKIITNGNDIKFENIFGRENIYYIERDLYIGGCSRLSKIKLIIRNNSTLTIGDELFIDNTREKGSLYKSLNSIEVEDTSRLILEDNASLRNEYGIGKSKHCVVLKGEQSSVYFNSKSQHWSSKSVVYAPFKSSTIFINSGKLTSKCNNKPSIFTNGKLEINGGKVSCIESGRDSIININDGIIGENNVDFSIKLKGTLYMTGGSILSYKKGAVLIKNKNSKIYLAPDHKGSINIGNDSPFLYNIANENLIEDKIDNKYINIQYYISDYNFESIDHMSNSNLKYYNVNLVNKENNINLPIGKYYLYFKAIYNNKEIKKSTFNNKVIKNVYIYSKIKYIEKT